MNKGRAAGSGLIRTAYYIWGFYGRCVDRFESVFLQSFAMKMLKGSADMMSACLEGSILLRMSRASNRYVYSDSALFGNIKKLFCRCETLMESYYEGSGFQSIAAEINTLFTVLDGFLSGVRWDRMKGSSKIIGILKRCGRK